VTLQGYTLVRGDDS